MILSNRFSKTHAQNRELQICRREAINTPPTGQNKGDHREKQYNCAQDCYDRRVQQKNVDGSRSSERPARRREWEKPGQQIPPRQIPSGRRKTQSTTLNGKTMSPHRQAGRVTSGTTEERRNRTQADLDATRQKPSKRGHSALSLDTKPANKKRNEGRQNRTFSSISSFFRTKHG